MNKLHVYTGDGKGKTTAAMGLVLRSLGHGNRVLVGQFIKDGTSGELTALRQFAKAEVFPACPLQGFLKDMTQEEQNQVKETQERYMVHLMKKVEILCPAMTVLDELGMALSLGVVSDASAQKLIEAALPYGETVVTGRAVPAWLMELADYVSVIRERKHPFATEGLPARKGVEW